MTEMLHRHSTLFGLGAAAITTVAVGQLTHWTPFWMIVTAMAGLFVLPRACYGWAEARAMEGLPDAKYERPNPERFTLQDLVLGKWALPAAAGLLVVVIVGGALVEMGVYALRLKTGPHAWYVIGSIYGVVHGPRGGSAWQRDYAEDGPFQSETQCNDALKASWHSREGLNYYCRDTLISDANAIRFGVRRDDWPKSSP